MFKFWKKTPPPTPSAPERKSVLGISDALGQFLIFGSHGAETPSSALNLYRESSAVYVPINKITEAFKNIQPVIENDEGEYITQHPLLDLLQQPSPFFDGSLFMETIARDYLVTNETEIVALGSVNRPPLELQPISPSKLSVVEGPGGYASRLQVSGNTLPGQYELKIERGAARYLNGALRELKQIRGYNTRNNSLLRGQSPLMSAANEARQHILGNEHNIKILEKGGRLSLVFHFEEDLEDDDFEAVKQRVREQYGGTSSESIGVTAGGKMTIDELGKTNKDMDFATLLRIAMDSVALVYNVPLPLVSNTAATFNNYREAKQALYDDAVLPLANRIFSGLGQWLLPRYGLDPKLYRLSYDILSISALRARVLDEIKTRREIGVESDNELRGLMAREPYQGGDDIYKPANLLPVGSDLFTEEPVVVRDMPTEDEATEE